MPKFPLSALILLYEKSDRLTMHCEYFAGFKSLMNALSPIDTEMLTGAGKYKPRPLLRFEENYALQEIARILNVDQSQLLDYYLDTIHEYYQPNPNRSALKTAKL